MHVRRDCMGATDIASFEALFESRGTTLPFVVQFKTLDGTTNTYIEPEENGYYVRFVFYDVDDKSGKYTLKVTMEEDL